MYQGTSELFNEKIKASSRTFRARLVNTSDSTDVIEKGFRKLTIAQISNEDKRSLSIGGITASELNVEIDNLSGVITGKEFDVQIGLLLDEEQNTYEWVAIGKFTAQKPTIKNNVTSFTAFDRFVSKLGGLYVSRLTYPASGKAILDEIATMSGVVINTDGLTDIMFPQKTVINSSGENVSANPFDGFTYREAIGYVAMAYGKFATVNRNGEVDLRWYTDTNYRVEKNMSYDDISVADTEYSVEYLNVTVNNDRNNPLIKGEGLTGISVGTPIFTTEMLNHAYSQVSGFKYIPTTLSFKGDPRIDLGDIVTVVKYDNTEVKVPVMSLDFDFDGGLICEIGSYGDTEQSEKAYASSPNANKYDRMYTDLLLLNQAIANKVTAEYVEAHYVATSKLDAVQAEITQAVIRDLETKFLTVDTADIRYANIELTNIEVANVGRLLADVGLITDMVIVDGHVTGVLDSVTINANNITSGTLTTDRLVIRGTDKSIVYELNNISGALQAKEVDTLNGEIITPRTINADRIVANSITSGELNVNEIFANSAIIKKIFSEDVEATGTITGATLKGAYAEIDTGNVGGFLIKDLSLSAEALGDDKYYRKAYIAYPKSTSGSNEDDLWIYSVQISQNKKDYIGLWYVNGRGDMRAQDIYAQDIDSTSIITNKLTANTGTINTFVSTDITTNELHAKEVTINGEAVATQGIYAYDTERNNWGTPGYIEFIRIKVIDNYLSNAGYTIGINSLNQYGEVKIKFGNQENVLQTTIEEFSQTGNLPQMYYTKTIRDNQVIIDIIATKAEFQDFCVTHINSTHHIRQRTIVSYQINFSTYLPSGAIPATQGYDYFNNIRGIGNAFFSGDVIANYGTGVQIALSELEKIFGRGDTIAGNANEIISTCFLRTNSTTTNVIDKNGFLLTFGVVDRQAAVQINIPYNASAVYLRAYWYGSWGSWRDIINV